MALPRPGLVMRPINHQSGTRTHGKSREIPRPFSPTAGPSERFAEPGNRDFELIQAVGREANAYGPSTCGPHVLTPPSHLPRHKCATHDSDPADQPVRTLNVSRLLVGQRVPERARRVSPNQERSRPSECSLLRRPTPGHHRQHKHGRWVLIDYSFTDQFVWAASGLTITSSPELMPARTAASELKVSTKAAPG